MPQAKKPVVIFCGPATNRIYAARRWRVSRRVSDTSGYVQVIGTKDDVTRAACVAVGRHAQRCGGCEDCSDISEIRVARRQSRSFGDSDDSLASDSR